MKRWPLFIFSFLPAACCLGQPQEAWVARYNGGFTNKNHTPLAMALDKSGNVYVAGSSQNASSNYDYVVLKYAPNGTQLWAGRYASTNGGNDTISGFALDKNGNAFVTGSAGTVKFNTNGTIGWTAAYAGNGVAVDTNGNTYVTGFSTITYATVKLDLMGSNVWLRTYSSIYGYTPAISERVAVDDFGNVYVAGWETWSGPPIGNYPRTALIKYDAAGNTVWTNAECPCILREDFKGLIVDKLGNVYVTGNDQLENSSFLTRKIDFNGQDVWGWDLGPPGVAAMVLDTNGNVYLTGAVYDGPPHFVYGTFNLGTNGQVRWQTNYYGPVYGNNNANAITLDSVGNVYVTGVSTNNGTANDWATIKYDNTTGNQLWVKRYNGPANGDDGAVAIAVAPDGSIYVTGYSANTSGGSDITTIKYVPGLNLQKRTDGVMQLQVLGGSSGQSYGFQASTNFEFWDPLGSSLADSNGVAQFYDTNAPFFLYRFYRGVSQP